MLLKDKVIWVTGASRGIGRATALRLASEGAQVIIAARDEEKLNALAEEIEAEGDQRPFVLPYDISDLQSIKDAFSKVIKQFKYLDGLINNAGILEEALLPMVTQDQIERLFTVNVYSTLYHMQYASRIMTRRKKGSIVNMSSIIGREGKEGLTVYAASKAAILGATMSASKELASLGIRVNAIAPGFIETDMTSIMQADKYEERVKAIKMQRAGKPEEVADTALYLVSDLSLYVTGQIIGVDGGMLE